MSGRKTPKSVQKKAQHLMREEGKGRREAFGAAYGMKRSGHLDKEGGYKKKRK